MTPSPGYWARSIPGVVRGCSGGVACQLAPSPPTPNGPDKGGGAPEPDRLKVLELEPLPMPRNGVTAEEWLRGRQQIFDLIRERRWTGPDWDNDLPNWDIYSPSIQMLPNLWIKCPNSVGECPRSGLAIAGTAANIGREPASAGSEDPKGTQGAARKAGASTRADEGNLDSSSLSAELERLQCHPNAEIPESGR